MEGRNNKVKFNDLVFPEKLEKMSFQISKELEDRIGDLAKEIVSVKEKGHPVMLFTETI